MRKYDAIMSSMNITDERRQKVDFSQVYYMMQNRFVGRSDKAADPRIAQFLAVYKNSPAVRQTIHQFYQGEQKLYRLAWLKK